MKSINNSSLIQPLSDSSILSFNIKKNVVTYSYLNPKYEDISDLTEKVETYLEGMDIKVLSKISVVIDEVMNNIISYGKTKTNKTLAVSIEKTPKGATLIFVDNSHPFNPLLRENRTVQENLEAGIVGGLGILIVKSISGASEYAYANNENILVIKFKLYCIYCYLCVSHKSLIYLVMGTILYIESHLYYHGSIYKLSITKLGSYLSPLSLRYRS